MRQSVRQSVTLSVSRIQMVIHLHPSVPPTLTALASYSVAAASVRLKEKQMSKSCQHCVFVCVYVCVFVQMCVIVYSMEAD